MGIGDRLLPELEQELATTRRLLERVPADQLAWRPHAKSMTLGRLAAHLATIPAWTRFIVKQPSLNFVPEDPANLKQPPPETLVAFFDVNATAAKTLVTETSDAAYAEPWTLLWKGQHVYTKPRLEVLRTMILSHSIHHRGQLTVYLRLHDVPLPPVYGPTADEAA